MSDTEHIGSKSLRDAGANVPFKIMFRDFNKGGYNLEGTNVTGDRFGIGNVLLFAF